VRREQLGERGVERYHGTGRAIAGARSDRREQRIAPSAIGARATRLRLEEHDRVVPGALDQERPRDVIDRRRR
jgi:hypothetical protein